MEIIRRIFRPDRQTTLSFMERFHRRHARFFQEEAMIPAYKILSANLDHGNSLGAPKYVTRNEDQTITVHSRPMEPDILLTPEGNLLRKGNPEPLSGRDYIRTAGQLLAEAESFLSNKG